MANTMNQSNDNFEDERKRVLKSTYFLRLLKLDEIPQFLNILKGDLTLLVQDRFYWNIMNCIAKNKKG